MITAAVFVLATAVSVPAPDGEVVLLPIARQSTRAALRHVAARGEARGSVLFIHGATFPSALSFGYPIEGRSWMRDLADAGFDAWALDFVGYGAADRDPRMAEGPRDHPPLGRARDVLPQIEQAVDFIRRKQKGRRLSIVAHSWGNVPAAMYVIAHPDRVDRFVMYGPVVARNEKSEPMTDAWILSDAKQQWQAFVNGVPPGHTPPFDRASFEVWMKAYLASDPASSGSVKVPSGPIADFTEMLGGKALYDPAAITVPVLILRGEWDAVTSGEDAITLYAALTAAPLKRMVWISGGTHRMHLERSRRQVYREVRTFLEGEE